jgi:ferredoxin-NADP reductase
MESHIVKVLATEYLTHNVKRFVTEKPAGYSYTPGQATDVAINRPGLESELRPFTFTSPVNAGYLEFIIKIYKGHNGVTEKLADIVPGDELIIHEVFGAIRYKGPGVFIAGGAGITPFIAIFRQLGATGAHPNNTLLFANHTTTDIILKDELKTFLGDRDIDIIRYPLPGEEQKILDKKLIAASAGDHATYYYICGPDQFTADMIGMLHELNVADQFIVFEQ